MDLNEQLARQAAAHTGLDFSVGQKVVDLRDLVDGVIVSGLVAHRTREKRITPGGATAPEIFTVPETYDVQVYQVRHADGTVVHRQRAELQGLPRGAQITLEDFSS